jgi:putative oxidoreductase
MHALLRLLADPGRPLWGTLALRVALAAVFIPVGLGKFVNHDAYVERFERWGFGALAGEAALAVGVLEVGCGLMLLLGLLPRAAALALAANMVGALLTAGRIDGGRDIWLPLVLIAALAVVVVWGGGRWALTPRALRRGRLGSGAVSDP